MASDAAKRFKKSTIVRSLMISSLRLLLGTSSRLLPDLTARWAEWRFRTPPRSASWREESDWLRGAETYTIPCGEHLLHVWALGTGPTVLLVHGWGGRGSQLGALAAPLAKRGFRVVGFDAPGHGRSSGRQSSLVEMAEAIDELTRNVGDLYGIVAHSAGAAATTFALHQARLKPARLIYLAPGVDPSGFVDYFTRFLGLTPTIADQIQKRIEERFDISFADLNSLELASRMDVPLRILHDPCDREVPWEGARALVERWPRASLVSLNGVGHYRILRAPETLAEVTSFLSAPESARYTSSTARLGVA